MLQFYLNMRSKGVTLCYEVMDADTSVARVAETGEQNESPDGENTFQSPTLISVSVCLNLCLAVVMAAGIIVGGTQLHHCPVQPYIPIYLIVLGVMGILSLILTFCASTRKSRKSCILSSTALCIVHFFNFCWLIAGSVWTYPIYPPDYRRGPQYCQITTYKLAFAVTTLLWVTLGLIFACGICVSVLNSREDTTAPDNLPSQNPSYGCTVAAAASTTGDV
ncbi:transmembrane protein 272-like [Nelusetta ayraudi]|uniref:transmembrane protein 272-like n=1 Tax=Nelusetta ayraudi TaxID=303726 RepID=UPI003F6F79F0